ncbi:hypothetical protein J6590_036164 [Homalodisca vitripennis]|nr:hypothetical protein J6590_036164 [Homalodisca vitripennis]
MYAIPRAAVVVQGGGGQDKNGGLCQLDVIHQWVGHRPLHRRRSRYLLDMRVMLHHILSSDHNSNDSLRFKIFLQLRHQLPPFFCPPSAPSEGMFRIVLS